MKTRQFVLAAFAVMIMSLMTIPAMAAADQTAAKMDQAKMVTTAPGPLAASVAASASSSQVAFETGYNVWQNRRSEAKSLQRSGLKKIIISTGMPLLAIPFIKSEGGTSGGMLKLIGGASLGLGIWGGYQVVQSVGKMGELEQEALLRGYYKVRVSDGFSVAPTERGVRAQVALSF